MGKFATYSKRGSAAAFGTMTAPVVGDWTFTSPVTGNYRFTLLASIPAPATQWGMRIRTVGGQWTLIPPQTATTKQSTAVGGSTQEGQIAWYAPNGDQLSPWSDLKSVVIT